MFCERCRIYVINSDIIQTDKQIATSVEFGNANIVSVKVDHFGYANDDYFLQRYLVNSDFYSETNGSIFFYTGNEGDIEMFANNTGFMWEHANAFNALLVFAEHRYYGVSLPYGSQSFKDNKHTGYLTSEQALADFAVLISHIKVAVPGALTAPVIAFGGSYGGMLAAWMRIKYPHLVNGAIASSAPVLMNLNAAKCEQFAEVVTKDFMKVSAHCVAAIRNSWGAIRRVGSTREGLKFLTNTFHLCKPLTLSTMNTFIDWLAATWQYMAMLDYPYPTNFLNPLPANPINEICKFVTQAVMNDQKLIKNMHNAASMFHNSSGNTVCFDIFGTVYTEEDHQEFEFCFAQKNGNVDCFDISRSGGAFLGEQGWDFQACTEMGMSLCQNGITDMFEPVAWNFSLYAEHCWEKWKVQPEFNKTLIIYGGKDITASSNIIFTNGKLDPWYPSGILESLSDTLIAILMENATHHLDLRSSNPADPISVIKARKVILTYISKWITDSSIMVNFKQEYAGKKLRM